jgi:hypothetical protein
MKLQSLVARFGVWYAGPDRTGETWRTGGRRRAFLDTKAASPQNLGASGVRLGRGARHHRHPTNVDQKSCCSGLPGCACHHHLGLGLLMQAHLPVNHGVLL